MTDEDLAKDDPIDMPILGVYGVSVTFRGMGGATAPTIREVEEAIENVLVELGGDGAVAVRVSANRTDR